MTGNRGRGQRQWISRAFRRKALSLFSSLLVALTALSLSPKTAKADQASNDANLIAAMDEIVESLAPANASATDIDDIWKNRLNQRFYKTTQLKTTRTLKWNFDTGVAASWKWSGAAADLPAPTGTGRPNSPHQIPYLDAGTKTYYVYSGEQLLYALDALDSGNHATQSTKLGYTVRIMADIDLNGQSGQGYNWPCISRVDQLTVDGGGHTIFNLRVDHSDRAGNNSNSTSYAAWIGKAQDFILQNIQFDHANLCGKKDAQVGPSNYTSATGIIGFATTTDSTSTTRFQNVGVTNSLLVGTNQVGGMYGRFSSGGMSHKSILNCYAENNVCFGGEHVGSLGSSAVNVDYIAYCYSVGCVVISTVGHSGGLFSCYGRVDKTAFCFVDAEVYGMVDTGVFTGVVGGAVGSTPCYIVSCFSSGFVEGRTNIGGFAGSIGTGATSIYDFYDCYSTALAGLRSTGTYLGGFLGRFAETTGPQTHMKNCYAAGEVGYTGLNVGKESTEPSAKGIGGMMGDGRTAQDWLKGCFESCYYDKQATAMREWDVGTQRGQYLGLTGVLTLDSVQNGNGLTNTNPSGGTTGFKGFTANSFPYYPTGTVTGAFWDYTAGGHYPELTAFKNATATNWGTQDRANLVKAYSLSSTATAKLDTWDYRLDKANGTINVGGKMNALTYDTVRDLTSSFTLTTNLVDNWDRIGDQDSKTHGESTSVIAGETLDVLSLKAVDGQFICDELVPGIEWLMATCSVGGQTATRRIRVIPTASLDAGLNAVITGQYDHADDVKLYYSTGARIENDRSDVTTGIFPDTNGQSTAISAEQRKMLDNAKNTYDKTLTQAGNDYYYYYYDPDTDQGHGAAAGYMGKSGENAEGSGLYVYIYKVTGIDASTNKIITGERITLNDANQTARTTGNAGKFNGYELLENTDQRYLIEYMWELKDGRVLSDAKMVRRAKLPFQVALNLYRNTLSAATLYPEGGYLYTGINAPSGSRLPLTDFSNITTEGRQAATDAGEAKYKETAQTAWKIKSPEETVTQVQLVMQNGDPAIAGNEVFTKSVDNPTPGQTISLPAIKYRIVYRNGGFYTIPEPVTRSYVLQYDAANATWHLEFNKAGEASLESPEILFNDVENCITVNVVVRSGADPTATNIPKTGDDTPLYLWVGIAIIALAGLVLVKRRRTW